MPWSTPIIIFRGQSYGRGRTGKTSLSWRGRRHWSESCVRPQLSGTGDANHGEYELTTVIGTATVDKYVVPVTGIGFDVEARRTVRCASDTCNLVLCIGTAGFARFISRISDM